MGLLKCGFYVILILDTGQDMFERKDRKRWAHDYQRKNFPDTGKEKHQPETVFRRDRNIPEHHQRLETEEDKSIGRQDHGDL